MLGLTVSQLAASVALAFVVSILCIFGLNNYVLMCLRIKVCRYMRARREMRELKECPFVTIQVAIYNEGNIVTRLLESCLKIDYPADKFEIVVIDDSTDETINILKDYEERYYPKIKIIHRDRRAGHKAGALNEALKNSKGEFILVLDADSVLKPDFLKRAIPLFLEDEKLGLIQGKLKHLNEEESWLTRTLAFISDWFSNLLQASFSGCRMVMGFVGHGGIFRRKALEDIGGWMSDTISEDLDIAYGLQLKGWKALYVEDAISFEEVPPSYFSAVIRFKRHIKGSLQNLIKHWWPIIRHKSLSLSGKIEALMQLAYSLVYPLGLLCLALTLLVYIIIPGAAIDGFWHSITGFVCSFIILISLPSVALIISPIPSFLIILLILAFALILFPKLKEIARRIKWANHEVIFGLLLVWYDNILNCLSPIAEILLGREGEWIPTERSLRRTPLNRSKKIREITLRILASCALTLFFFVNAISIKNFSLNSLGLLLLAGFWLCSAYLIIRN